jgi:hypothetical protein
MKKLTIALCLAITFAVPIFAQSVDPCTQTTKLTGGTSVDLSNGNQKTGTISGTEYHYEIWVNSRPSSAKLTLFGANQGGGGAFKAEWNNNDDYLGRVGYNWGTSGAKWDTYSNLCADFNYTRSANGTGGDYSYIGIYGWTQNPVMEWYIIDDWFGNGQLGPNTICYPNGCNSLGSVTVDGGTYNIYTNTRPAGSGCVGCNDQAFPQIFSIRQNMSSGTRKCGTYSITKHFEAWSKISSISSKIGNNLYEAKFLAEAGGGTGSLEMTYLKMSKTGGCYGSGGTTPSSSSAAASSSSKASSSSAAASSSSKASSSSAAASSSSKASSSSAAVSSSSSNATGQQTCGEYQTSYCGGLAYSSVPDNLTTMPTTGKCLYIGNFGTIQPALNSTVAINGEENTCSNEWNGCNYNTKPATKDGGYYVYVKTGTINDYQNNGWKDIVAKTKPTCTSSSSAATSSSSNSSSTSNSSSSSAGGTPILKNHIPITHFSLQTLSDKTLRLEANAKTVVEIFNLRGDKVASLNVSGSQTVKLSLPSGVYFAKVHGIKSVRFVLK